MKTFLLFFQAPPAIGEKKVDGRHDYSCPKELSDDSAWTQQLYVVSARPVFESLAVMGILSASVFILIRNVTRFIESGPNEIQ